MDDSNRGLGPRRGSCPGLRVLWPQASEASVPGVEEEPVALAHSPLLQTQPLQDDAAQLALALEKKLKLAPILARRLDNDVSHSSSSGLTSSKSSSRAQSPRVPERAPLSYFPKLPSLLRRIEGRHAAAAALVGSSNLPEICTPVDAASPTANKTPAAGHSFERAKRQVDKDLEVFKLDAAELFSREMVHGVWQAVGTELAQEQDDSIQKLLDWADECIESHLDDFRMSVMDVVDLIEEQRSLVGNRKIKVLYTKLLLILTRCSRLLITEQQNLFATEPRQPRFQGRLSFTHSRIGPSALSKLLEPPVEEEPEDAICRSHTMPVPQMLAIAQELQKSSSSGSREVMYVTGDRHSPGDGPSRTSKLSMGSHRSKLASEVSFRLMRDGTLEPNRESQSSQCVASSEGDSPALATHHHTPTYIPDLGTHPSTESDLHSMESGSPGSKKKKKGMFRKLKSKMQGLGDSFLSTLKSRESSCSSGDGDSGKIGKLDTSINRSGSFLGGALNFLRGRTSGGAVPLASLQAARSGPILKEGRAGGPALTSPRESEGSIAARGALYSRLSGISILSPRGILTPTGEVMNMTKSGPLRKGGLAHRERDLPGGLLSGLVGASSRRSPSDNERTSVVSPSVSEHQILFDEHSSKRPTTSRVRFAPTSPGEELTDGNKQRTSVRFNVSPPPPREPEQTTPEPSTHVEHSRPSTTKGAGSALAQAMERAQTARSINGLRQSAVPPTMSLLSHASCRGVSHSGSRACSTSGVPIVNEEDGDEGQEVEEFKTEPLLHPASGWYKKSRLSTATPEAGTEQAEHSPLEPSVTHSGSTAPRNSVSNSTTSASLSLLPYLTPPTKWRDPTNQLTPLPASAVGWLGSGFMHQGGLESPQGEYLLPQGESQSSMMDEPPGSPQRGRSAYGANGIPLSYPSELNLADRVSPEDLMMVCSVCEETWPTSRLEEHSELCAVLSQLTETGLTVDPMLTTLANVIEEQIDMCDLPQHLRPEIMQLVSLARTCAALQPDGSKVPHARCLTVLKALSEMSDPHNHARALSTVTITYARRMLKLVEDKTSVLIEPFRSQGGRRASGDGSGSSTPRSAPPQQGMCIEDFEILKPVSRGAFGRVYLARKHATGDLFAIKVMKKRDLIRKNMVESVNNERNILAMANNPFVVRFYYSFTSQTNLYIVMEYLNGGDCYSLLRKFGCLDEDVARLYVAETVLALEYCHAQGIIHRDLKPDNMLISANGHIKLTDFGLSCIGVIDRTDTLGNNPTGEAPMEVDYAPEDYDRDSSMSNAIRASGTTDSGHSNATGAGMGLTGVNNPQDRATAPPSIPSGGGGMTGQDVVMEDMCSQSSASGRTSLPLHLSTSGQSGLRRSLPGVIPGSNLNPAAYHQRTSAGSGFSTLQIPPGSTAGGSESGSGPAAQLFPAPLLVPESERKRAVGTPDYLAPELLLGTGHGADVDWWALGAILYEFVAGIPPFNADSPEEIFDNILDRAITWPEDEEDMSLECRDLIDKLLQPNTLRRMGHRGAGEIKMHAWFKGVDWTDLARTKAAFVPMVDDEMDTSYFEKKDVSAKSMAEDLASFVAHHRRSMRQSDTNAASGTLPDSQDGIGVSSGVKRALSRVLSPSRVPADTSRFSSSTGKTPSAGGGGLSTRISAATDRSGAAQMSNASPTAAQFVTMRSAVRDRLVSENLGSPSSNSSLGDPQQLFSPFGMGQQQLTSSLSGGLALFNAAQISHEDSCDPQATCSGSVGSLDNKMFDDDTPQNRSVRSSSSIPPFWSAAVADHSQMPGGLAAWGSAPLSQNSTKTGLTHRNASMSAHSERISASGSRHRLGERSLADSPMPLLEELGYSPYERHSAGSNIQPSPPHSLSGKGNSVVDSPKALSSAQVGSLPAAWPNVSQYIAVRASSVECLGGPETLDLTLRIPSGSSQADSGPCAQTAPLISQLSAGGAGLLSPRGTISVTVPSPRALAGTSPNSPSSGLMKTPSVPLGEVHTACPSSPHTGCSSPSPSSSGGAGPASISRRMSMLAPSELTRSHLAPAASRRRSVVVQSAGHAGSGVSRMNSAKDSDVGSSSCNSQGHGLGRGPDDTEMPQAGSNDQPEREYLKKVTNEELMLTMEEEGSGSSEKSTGTDSQEADGLPKTDPFGNFSFTNYAILTQANVEKLMKLRETYGDSIVGPALPITSSGSMAVGMSTQPSGTTPPQSGHQQGQGLGGGSGGAGVNANFWRPSTTDLGPQALEALVNRVGSGTSANALSAPSMELYGSGGGGLGSDPLDPNVQAQDLLIPYMSGEGFGGDRLAPSMPEGTQPTAWASTLRPRQSQFSGGMDNQTGTWTGNQGPLQPAAISLASGGSHMGFGAVPNDLVSGRSSDSGSPTPVNGTQQQPSQSGGATVGLGGGSAWGPPDRALDRPLNRGSLSVLTANLLHQQVSSIIRQQTMAHSPSCSAEVRKRSSVEIIQGASLAGSTTTTGGASRGGSLGLGSGGGSGGGSAFLPGSSATPHSGTSPWQGSAQPGGPVTSGSSGTDSGTLSPITRSTIPDSVSAPLPTLALGGMSSMGGPENDVPSFTPGNAMFGGMGQGGLPLLSSYPDLIMVTQGGGGSSGGSSLGSGSGLATLHSHQYQPSPLVNCSRVAEAGGPRPGSPALLGSKLTRRASQRVISKTGRVLSQQHLQQTQQAGQPGSNSSGGSSSTLGQGSQPTGARALLAVAAANSYMASRDTAQQAQQAQQAQPPQVRQNQG